MNFTNNKQASKQKLLLLAVVVLLIIGVVWFFLLKPKEPNVAKTSGQYTKGLQGESKSNTTSTSSSDKLSGSQPSSMPNLIQPSGTFANVYTAKIDDQMSSTCNTSPGASCQITFTNSGLSKSLPTKTADSGGGTYWAWKPKDIGLAAGTWHITVRATSGSISKTTDNDPLTLEIIQ